MTFEVTPAIEYLEGGEYLVEMRYRGERSHVGSIYSLKSEGCPFEDPDAVELEVQPCQCHPYAGMPLSIEWTEDDENYWLSNGNAGNVLMYDKREKHFLKHLELSSGRKNSVIR